MAESEQDPIEQLKRQLDTPGQPEISLRRSPLRLGEDELPRVWEPPVAAGGTKLNTSMLKKILYLSILFCVAMGGLAAWALWRGDNTVKTGNVDLTIVAPALARAGEEIALEVALKNNNTIPLEFVDLILKYPPGTRLPGQVTETTRDRINLGTLAPGAEKRQSYKVLLFGEKGIKVPITASLEYRLADSNAIFDRSISREVEISDAPVSLKVTGEDSVNAGGLVELEVAVTSNATSILPAVAVVVKYPTGFVPATNEPAATQGNNVWVLKNLEPGEEEEIILRGTLGGQNNDAKTFRVEAGVPDPAGEPRVAVLYDLELVTIALSEPSVQLGIALNNNTAPEQVVGGQQSVSGQLKWLNSLAGSLEDVEVALTFNGTGFNPYTVSAPGGIFRATDRTLVWNKSSLGNLSTLASGATAELNFKFDTPKLGSGNEFIKNPTLELLATLKGRESVVGGDGKKEVVKVESTKRLKLNSTIGLASQAFYYTEEAGDRGPLPPKVGEETEYTIIWTVTNSSNDLREATVTATLPPYMKWLGFVGSQTETVKFSPIDSGGGELVWSLGSVRAGTGFGLGARQVIFRVGLTPALSQLGTAPVILSAPIMSAVDTFTGVTLKAAVSRPIDTNLSLFDSRFRLGQDKVVE